MAFIYLDESKKRWSSRDDPFARAFVRIIRFSTTFPIRPIIDPVETGEIQKLVNHVEPRFLRIPRELSGG